MKILVTGAAGFIGFHIAKSLLSKGHQVIGLDNINSYYDVKLKYDRLKILGIAEKDASVYNQISESSVKSTSFHFIRMHLEDKEHLTELFKKQKFDIVCHLAAQAGVRYSLENPGAYIESNLIGFFNVLESSKNNNIKHLIYASSSSVYGLNQKVPFSTSDNADRPISLYAATKKSNELMSHVYSYLYKLPTTGLRFFTVYGPWGRPDMAMFLFTDAIVNGKPLNLFNNGDMHRDFTYIDDISSGVVTIVEKSIQNRIKEKQFYKIYNIGNSKSVRLLDFIEEIEKQLGVKSEKKMLPIQKGDVKKTWADVNDLTNDFDYTPNTSMETGISIFLAWYKDYFKD